LTYLDPQAPVAQTTPRNQIRRLLAPGLKFRIQFRVGPAKMRDLGLKIHDPHLQFLDFLIGFFEAGPV
jgi:hypothetical protein